MEALGKVLSVWFWCGVINVGMLLLFATLTGQQMEGRAAVAFFAAGPVGTPVAVVLAILALVGVILSGM